jgi:hypothetical protein
MNKKNKTVVGAVAFLIIFAGGFFYWKHHNVSEAVKDGRVFDFQPKDVAEISVQSPAPGQEKANSPTLVTTTLRNREGVWEVGSDSAKDKFEAVDPQPTEEFLKNLTDLTGTLIPSSEFQANGMPYGAVAPGINPDFRNLNVKLKNGAPQMAVIFFAGESSTALPTASAGQQTILWFRVTGRAYRIPGDVKKLFEINYERLQSRQVFDQLIDPGTASAKISEVQIKWSGKNEPYSISLKKENETWAFQNEEFKKSEVKPLSNDVNQFIRKILSLKPTVVLAPDKKDSATKAKFNLTQTPRAVVHMAASDGKDFEIAFLGAAPARSGQDLAVFTSNQSEKVFGIEASSMSFLELQYGIFIDRRTPYRFAAADAAILEVRSGTKTSKAVKFNKQWGSENPEFNGEKAQLFLQKLSMQEVAEFMNPRTPTPKTAPTGTITVKTTDGTLLLELKWWGTHAISSNAPTLPFRYGLHFPQM